MRDLSLDVSNLSSKSFNLYITLNESPDIGTSSNNILAYLEEKKRAFPVIQKRRQLCKTVVALQKPSLIVMKQHAKNYNCKKYVLLQLSAFRGLNFAYLISLLIKHNKT